jgi:tellurite resistance protein TerC
MNRIVVGVIGGTVTLIGIALIVLPGPAFIVIPIGLSILATEFVWAKRWLAKARAMTSRFTSKSRSGGTRKTQSKPDESQ